MFTYKILNFIVLLFGFVQVGAGIFGVALLDFGCEFFQFVDFTFEEVEDLPTMEKLNLEKECIGIYVSGHPLDDYRTIIEQCSTLTTLNLEREAKFAKAQKAAKRKEYFELLKKSLPYSLNTWLFL